MTQKTKITSKISREDIPLRVESGKLYGAMEDCFDDAVDSVEIDTTTIRYYNNFHQIEEATEEELEELFHPQLHIINTTILED